VELLLRSVWKSLMYLRSVRIMIPCSIAFAEAPKKIPRTLSDGAAFSFVCSYGSIFNLMMLSTNMPTNTFDSRACVLKASSNATCCAPSSKRVW